MKLYVIGLVLLVLFIASANAQSEKTVSLGGHTFTADLPDGWRSIDNSTVQPWNDGNEENATPDYNGWKALSIEPWDYPLYPNAPKDDEYHGMYSSVVNLAIVIIPAEEKKNQLDEDIRIYGSADKIPDDQKAKDIVSILTALAPPYLNKHLTDYSDKDLTFGDRPAHLAEMTAESPSNYKDETSYGRMAILLDDNTVAVIDVRAAHFSPSGMFYDGSAWDIINSISVS